MLEPAKDTWTDLDPTALGHDDAYLRADALIDAITSMDERAEIDFDRLCQLMYQLQDNLRDMERAHQALWDDRRKAHGLPYGEALKKKNDAETAAAMRRNLEEQIAAEYPDHAIKSGLVKQTYQEWRPRDEHSTKHQQGRSNDL